MDVLTMTALCAQAMDVPLMGSNIPMYNPLGDDAQAMALVKKFKLHIGRTYSGNWYAEINDDDRAHGPDLNRAIVECIAKMQVDRTASETLARSAVE